MAQLDSHLSDVSVDSTHNSQPELPTRITVNRPQQDSNIIEGDIEHRTSWLGGFRCVHVPRPKNQLPTAGV